MFCPVYYDTRIAKNYASEVNNESRAKNRTGSRTKTRQDPDPFYPDLDPAKLDPDPVKTVLDLVWPDPDLGSESKYLAMDPFRL